jgi:hypothetical protein
MKWNTLLNTSEIQSLMKMKQQVPYVRVASSSSWCCNYFCRSYEKHLSFVLSSIEGDRQRILILRWQPIKCETQINRVWVRSVFHPGAVRREFIDFSSEMRSCAFWNLYKRTQLRFMSVCKRVSSMNAFRHVLRVLRRQIDASESQTQSFAADSWTRSNSNCDSMRFDSLMESVAFCFRTDLSLDSSRRRELPHSLYIPTHLHWN